MLPRSRQPDTTALIVARELIGSASKWIELFIGVCRNMLCVGPFPISVVVHVPLRCEMGFRPSCFGAATPSTFVCLFLHAASGSDFYRVYMLALHFTLPYAGCASASIH